MRVKLPAEKQAKHDTFMEGYFDFGTIFEKTDDELVQINNQFGEYYLNIYEDLDLEDAQTFDSQDRPGGWMVWAQYISLGLRYDLRPAISDVAVPVLVIHGKDDLQTEAASRLYADVFPNAEFVVIERAAHAAFEEQPEIFAEIFTNFLNQ